jgi:UDP-GlcNAc:undecaprenyl-phosphate/decaprenyl-phosphate GlcNAc-1-phosphate transferase
MIELAAYLFVVSLLAVSVLTPIAIKLGERWGVLDVPGGRKIHSTAIPLTGGWAIFAALSVVVWGHLAVALLLRSGGHVSDLPLLLQDYVRRSPEMTLKVLPVWLGALAMFGLGVLDDLRGMSVRRRLVYQTLIAVALVAVGFKPSLVGMPGWVAAVLGVVWIVGITNAFNFLDGLDGLSAGVALMGTTALAATMAIADQPTTTCYIAALCGIILGFLRYNFNPARIFLGSSGSLLLGFLMATSTLLVNYIPLERNWLMPVLAPILIVAIPLYDTTSVVLIRLLQRRSIAEGDQSHFHHRLLRLGFSHRQAVMFLWLVAFSAGLSAINLVGASFRRSLIILLQASAVLFLLILAERVAVNVRRKLLERPRRDRRRTDPATDVPAPRTDVGVPRSDIVAPQTDVMRQPVGSGDSGRGSLD